MSAFELINERMTSRTVMYDGIWIRQMEMKSLFESVCVILNGLENRSSRKPCSDDTSFQKAK